MRAVIQRVSQATVSTDGEITGKIDQGLLILLGIESEDTKDDADWLAKKTTSLRIFDDDQGLMNLSVQDVDGKILVVSQFTLHAKYKKGTRPSFIRAANPDQAVPLYEYFKSVLEKFMNKPTESGKFGAHMDVDMVNAGPVTIIIDTKNKE